MVITADRVVAESYFVLLQRATLYYSTREYDAVFIYTQHDTVLIIRSTWYVSKFHTHTQ